MCSNKCNYVNSTLFTCDQMDDYCNQYNNYTGFVDSTNLAANYGMGAAGFVGFIGYICMAGTLTKMKLDVASSIYYQSSVAIEIVHMIIMASSGIIRQLPGAAASYSMTYYVRKMSAGWFFGDAMKLVVIILATLLSMGSTCALLAPMFYRKFNKGWVASLLTAVSLVVSVLIYFPIVLSTDVIPAAAGGWTTVGNSIQESVLLKTSVNIQYISKMVFSVCLLALSCAIVVGLIIKSRLAKSLTGRDNENWRATRRLTYLTLIIGITALIDTICWIIFRYLSVNTIPVLGADAVKTMSYEDATNRVYMMTIVGISRMTQIFMGILVHCGRFYLYLMFNRSFRRGFSNFISSKSGFESSVGSKP